LAQAIRLKRLKNHHSACCAYSCSAVLQEMVQIWMVTGGEGKGGILVREGASTGSAKVSERLATGAVLKEVELIGDRLRFRRVAGAGPDEGWISISLAGGKDLAVRVGAIKNVPEGESNNWNIDSYQDPAEYLRTSLRAMNGLPDRAKREDIEDEDVTPGLAASVGSIAKEGVAAAARSSRSRLSSAPSLWTLGEKTPEVHASAYIAPGAAVIGIVRLEAHSSVWFGCTVRGDNELITIGEGSVVEDSSVIHCDPGLPITIGKNCLIGAQSCLHGCTIGDNCVIGTSCVILDGARIGDNCFVGAGTQVREGKAIDNNSFVRWNRKKRGLEVLDQPRPVVQNTASMYVQNKDRFRSDLQPFCSKLGIVTQPARSGMSKAAVEESDLERRFEDLSIDMKVIRRWLSEAPSLWSLGEQVPNIHSSAYVAPGAVVIGSVTVQEGASVWFNCVVRADSNFITIGQGSSVRDDSILHCDAESPLTIGKNCLVGHHVCLHGCTIGDHCIIGTKTIIEDKVSLGKAVLVEVNSRLEQGMTIPDNSYVHGDPAIVTNLKPEHKSYMARVYVHGGPTDLKSFFTVYPDGDTGLKSTSDGDRCNDLCKNLLAALPALGDAVAKDEPPPTGDASGKSLVEDMVVDLQVLQTRLRQPSSLWALGDKRPRIDESAYVAPGANIVGAVVLHSNSSVWFNCTLRGDSGSITIGRGTDVQDNSVLHCEGGGPLTIGDNCLVGHQVCLHSCKVGDNCLVGMRTTILEGASVGNNCFLAAGCFVEKGRAIPDDSFVMGSPARRIDLVEEQWAQLMYAASSYVENKGRFQCFCKAFPCQEETDVADD